jgi:lipid-A-disaccharide synthase
VEKTHDLLLSIFPFEKEWYAARAPHLRVEFVGNPIIGRFPALNPKSDVQSSAPRVVLLPGSRWDEVRRHWPVVTGAFELLRLKLPALRARLILPSEDLARATKALGVPKDLAIQIGGVSAALAEADLAITKSGTITLECAFFGVPAVVFYKTSWPTYWIAKRLITVNFAAMPNLLAHEELFPEFIQAVATPENVANAAFSLLHNGTRHLEIKMKLAQVVTTLGPPGAPQRAAGAIVSLLR